MSTEKHEGSRVSTPRNENDIVVYHVGGEGDYGPVMALLRRFPQNIRLVVFEARSDTTDLAIAERFDQNGTHTTVINKGIDEEAGRPYFFVNKYPLSSSLLGPSPLSSREDPVYEWVHTWGQNAELRETIVVDTMSLDQIIASGLVPPPDVISIDAQGAELRILRGAKDTLEKHNLAVISEVEFFEIYDGQGLFDDQMQELGRKGYRLVNVYNQQHWHPGPAAGTGFLTVGEALFVRFLHELPHTPGGQRRGYINPASLSDSQLIRLAGIAMGFNLLSYCYRVTGFIKARSPALFEQLRNSPYREAAALYEAMEANMDKYKQDQRFFLKAIRQN